MGEQDTKQEIKQEIKKETNQESKQEIKNEIPKDTTEIKDSSDTENIEVTKEDTSFKSDVSAMARIDTGNKGVTKGDTVSSEMHDAADAKEKNNKPDRPKRKIGKKRIIFAVFLAVSVAYFLFYTGENREELLSKEGHVLSYAPEDLDSAEEVLLENDKEYKSVIVPEQDGVLTEITVRMKKVSPDFTGNLIFRIYGAGGEEKICIEVSNTDLLASTLDYVTMFGMTVPVNKGEKLWISWMVTGNEGEPTCLYLYDNEKGEVSVEGNAAEGKSLQQTGTMYYSCRWTVILAVVISALVLVILFLNDTAGRYIRRFVAAVLPVVALFLWLLSTDNLAFWKGENLWPELMGLYLLLGMALCIFHIRGGSIFYLGFGLTFTLVNYYMEAFRAQPLLITDVFSMGTALNVAGNYTYEISYPMISVVMIYVALLVLMITYSYAVAHEPDGAKVKIQKKKKLLLRCSGTVLCMAAFIGLSESLDFYISSWDMAGTVTEHGWLTTNALLAKICIDNKPEGYDKSRTVAFIDENAKDASMIEGAVVPQNLIVIMDESFADLSVLGNLETDAEVMPFLDSLENSSRVEKGYIGVHVMGGGTISTEWEFLTGGNTGLMNIGSLYPYTLLQSKTGNYNYEGICSGLADIGYETIAMHPYLATNYRRKSVYPLLGFQDFLSWDNYYENAGTVRLVRNFVSDETDFDGIIERYENKKSAGLFIFNVTMQNHGGYSNQLEEYDVTALNIDCDELDLYLTLVHKTDQALEKLLSYFEQVDEPTMIVFFGDHQPALTDDFYRDIYGEDSLDDAQREKMFVTPYLIWSNYDRQTYDMPYINTGYLEAIVKAEAGLELNQWEQYLLGIMQEYPVVGQYGLYDADYNFTSYDDLSDRQEQAVQQMQHAMYYWWTYH